MRRWAEFYPWRSLSHVFCSDRAARNLSCAQLAGRFGQSRRAHAPLHVAGWPDERFAFPAAHLRAMDGRHHGRPLRNLIAMRFLLVLVLVLLLTIALAQIAGAHEIERLGPQTPREIIRAWSFEPGIIIPLLLSAILYGCGLV